MSNTKTGHPDLPARSGTAPDMPYAKASGPDIGEGGRHHRTSLMSRSKSMRWMGAVALAAVLGLAFMGHLSADMQLQWENLMALCGF